MEPSPCLIADVVRRFVVCGSSSREYAMARRLRREGNLVVMVVPPDTAFSLPEGVSAVVSGERSPEAALLAAAMCPEDILIVQDEMVAKTGTVDVARGLGLASVGPTSAQARLEMDRDALEAAVGGYLLSPRTIVRSPNQLRRKLAEHGGAGIVRSTAIEAHQEPLAVTAWDNSAARSMLLRQGEVVFEPLHEGPVYTAYAAPGPGGEVTWSPALKCSPFIDGVRPIKTGGMLAQVAEGSVPARWPVLNEWAKALFGNGEPWRTFVGIEVADTAVGPVILDLDCQIGNPETSTLLAATSMCLTDLLSSLARGLCPAWGEATPAVSVALSVPGYPHASPTLMAAADFDAFEAAGLSVDLGAYMKVASMAIAGPSRAAVVTARGSSAADALTRLWTAMPAPPSGLVVPDTTGELGKAAPDERSLGAQLLSEIDRVVVTPARELLGPGVSDGLEVSASIAAASMSRELAAHGGEPLADRIFAALWPEGVTPEGWWETPLAGVIGQRAQSLARYRVSVPDACRILRVSRARLYQLVDAAVLVRHPVGGITLRSVLDRRAKSGARSP